MLLYVYLNTFGVKNQETRNRYSVKTLLNFTMEILLLSFNMYAGTATKHSYTNTVTLITSLTFGLCLQSV
jgi:hypothetical protein